MMNVNITDEEVLIASDCDGCYQGTNADDSRINPIRALTEYAAVQVAYRYSSCLTRAN